MPKLFERVKGLFAFGVLQLANQAITVCTGILVLRLVSIDEFGVYTICMATLGTLSVLSDGGVGSSTLALAGRAVGDRLAMGSIVHAAESVRVKLVIAVGAVGLPILLYFLLKTHVAIWQAAALLMIVSAMLWIAVHASTLLAILRLHGQMNQVQQVDLGGALVRLTLTVLLVLIYPSAISALFASTMVSAGVLIVYQRRGKIYIEKTAVSTVEQRHLIWSGVKDLLPAGLYWCFSGNIAIWLLGAQGHVAAVGQIGGLGRLSQIFQLLNAVFSNYVVPSFSKAKSLPEMKMKFLQVALGVPVCLGLVVATLLVGGDLVWLLLGKSFSGLGYELFLVLAASSLTIYGGVLFQLCAARGWRLKPFWAILPNVLFLILGAFLFDLEKTQGVLLVGVMSNIPNVILFLGLGYYRLKREQHA